MCESSQTTSEHVPPKCLFPELKDLPAGQDLRKNLIKVPSCDVHNLRKSKDDEYLMYVLASCHPINDIGHQQARSKLFRSVQHNPSLMNRMIAQSAPGVTKDQDGVFATRVFFAEGDRLDSVLKMMGRALYFHHFGRKWVHRIKLVLEFMFFTEGKDVDAYNRAVADVRAVGDLMFASVPPHGENPQVFRYWVVEDKPRNFCFMRLGFYGETKVTLSFLPADI
jgi:hypothetical protein